MFCNCLMNMTVLYITNKILVIILPRTMSHIKSMNHTLSSCNGIIFNPDLDQVILSKFLPEHCLKVFGERVTGSMVLIYINMNCRHHNPSK